MKTTIPKCVPEVRLFLYSNGGVFYSWRDICSRLRLSKPTIKRALKALVERGVVSRRRKILGPKKYCFLYGTG